MQINILKRTENEIRIEIVGSGHGICNLLQKKLLEDDTVDMAGYDVPHPLASSPIIYVRMKNGADPEQALLRGAEKAIESNQAFGKALDDALKA